MPAANTDLALKVAQNKGWQLGSGGIPDASATSFALVSGLDIPTDTAVILTIDRVDANKKATPSKMERILGVMSGDNVTSCIRGVAGTAQAHNPGAVVEVVIDAVLWNKLIEAFMEEHNQDGTHNESAISAPTHAAASKTTPVDADEIGIVDSAASNVLKKLTWANLKATLKTYFDTLYGSGGWTTYSAVVPTRGTADDPTYPLVFTGVDLTGVFSEGMRIKLTQNSIVRYGFINAAPVYSSGNTTVSVLTRCNDTSADLDVLDTGTYAITGFAYSTHKTPHGFPTAKEKWTIRVTDGTERSAAVSGSPVNIGTTNAQITVPIGNWDLGFAVNMSGDRTTAGTGDTIRAGLSTTNNSYSDLDLVAYAGGYGSGVASSSDVLYGQARRSKAITLTSKTLYYLNGLMENAGNVYWRNSIGSMVLEAVCGYL